MMAGTDKTLASVATAAAVLLLAAALAEAASCPARCKSCGGGVADCASSRLTVPPPAYPAGTRQIDLSGNAVRMLGPVSFREQMPDLEVLKLQNNRIVNVRPDALRKMPNLVTLDLTGNRIFRLNRRSLKGLSNLRTLTLNRNRIRRIDRRVFDSVTGLSHLNLAKNRIRRVGASDLAALSMVQYLDLQDNQIATIHADAFKNLHRLRYLFLSNNPIGAPPQFRWGPELQLLDMSACGLTAVPALPARIVDLRLGRNNIQQIQHTDFLNATALKMLALHENRLSFVADGTFRHCDELQEIWLRGNQLVYIPRNLPDGVRRLHMDSNHLAELEAGVFGAASRLEYLTVESNRLTALRTGALSGLRFLNTLNFQGNQIRVLETRSLAGLGSLAQLMLSSNPVGRVENEALHRLDNLTLLQAAHMQTEEVQLDYNPLPHAPRLQTLSLMNSPGLAEALMEKVADPQFREVLSEMRTLDLSYNGLAAVPERVRTAFPALRQLSLDSNALHCTRPLAWLGRWMAEEARSPAGVSFYSYEQPVCERPYRLLGQPLAELAASDWAEPSELTNEAQPSPQRWEELQRDAPADGGPLHAHTVARADALTAKKKADVLKKTSATKKALPVGRAKAGGEAQKRKDAKRMLKEKKRRDRAQRKEMRRRRKMKAKGQKKNRKGKKRGDRKGKKKSRRGGNKEKKGDLAKNTNNNNNNVEMKE